MAEQGRSTDRMAIFLAVVVLGGFGGGLLFGTPFESSRPKEPVAVSLTDNDEVVPARLWQDPFTAVERCRQQYHVTEGDDKRCGPGDLRSVTLGTPEKLTEESVIIMPVMVYGGAYSENVEKRRRRRYAVLSAMAMHHYRPDDAENIRYFEPSSCNAGACIVPYEWLQPNLARYDPNTDKRIARPPVLLLWLDEQRFRHKPLTKLAELLGDVQDRAFALPPDPKPKVILLGPAGSTVLRSMVHQAINLAGYTATGEENDELMETIKKWNLSIFSPLATASAKLIVGKNDTLRIDLLGRNDDGKFKKCSDIEACKMRYADPSESSDDNANRFTSLFIIEQLFEKIGWKFFRTIASDKDLLGFLINKEFPKRDISVKNSDDIVILVSEWDTFYGRALPEAFIRTIKEYRIKKIAELENIGCEHGVCYYVYMRGLDGELLDSASSESARTEQDHGNDLERAVGVNRFDYLRRLGQQIKNDLAGIPGKVRAVGVLGSDVYDKLLALQAFRPSFPRALFFTTDADARYLHPAEFRWARNLIILSGYDLRPGRYELLRQEDSEPRPGIKLPPFRDSYQTSMFVATRLAMRRLDGAFLDNQLRRELATEIAKPKAFEVGWSTLIPLNEADQEYLRRQFGTSWRPRPWAIALLAVLLPILSFSLIQTTWRRGSYVTLILLFAVLVPLVIIAWVYFQDGTSGEPLPLLGGANMLPSMAILFITLGATIVFLLAARSTLRKNARSLITEFKLVRNKKWAQLLPPQRYFSRRARPLHRLRDLSVAMKLAIVKRPFVCLWAVMYFGFSVAFILEFGGILPPARGYFTFQLYRIGFWLTLFFYFLLISLFANEVHRCRNLAYQLTAGQLDWDNRTIEKFGRQQEGTVADWSSSALAPWIGIQLLAKRTMRVEKIVYYPFVIVLLLIMERSGWFDNWGLAPSITVVLGSTVLILITCVLLMRRSISVARLAALEAMQGALRVTLAEHGPGENRAENADLLRLLISEVETERRGAFCPLSSDPILKALLMALGGYGSLFSLDYFATLL